jgi:dipeptidyl aminopeptidase/acylaminoacyl peptidase
MSNDKLTLIRRIFRMNVSIHFSLKKMFAALIPCAGMMISLLGAAPPLSAQRVPLSPESVVKDVDLFPYESILSSPDGKWVAYQAGDPSKPMRTDYVGQRFTKSGYPMLATALASSVWVSEVATGKSIEMSSPTGSSWFPNWSPDGRYLAFFSDRGGQAALWIWDRQTQQTKQVSEAFVHSSWWRERPLWSADGKTILCKILPEGMSLEDVLKLAPGYQGGGPKAQPAELPGPTVHVYAFHPGENQAKAGKPGNSDQLEGAAYFDSFYLSDLARIEVSTGKVERLLRKIRPMSYAYSPDQSNIVVLNVEGMVPHTQQLAYTLKVYGMADKSTRDMAKGFFDANNLTTRVTWSPDSMHLAYSDSGKTAERACYVVDVKTGEKLKASTQIPTPDFSWGPPIWDKTGKWIYLVDGQMGHLWEVSSDGKHTREVVKLPGVVLKDLAVEEAAGTYWSPDDGKTLYVRAHDDVSKKDGIYAVRVQTGEWEKVHEGDEAIGMREMGSLVGTSQGPGTLVYSSESASHPEDVWSLDLKSRKVTQISNLNPQYNAASLGKVRLIDFISLMGERLHAVLLLPGDYHEGERYPLIVWMYGGDYGSDKGNRFAFAWGSAFNPQMWASRGYAVLYPDVPLHPGTPVDDLVSAVIPAVNKAVELGIADADRMAVMGQSFGGYNTLSLLTRTTIFKAAVATSAAPTDLFQGYTCFESGLAACVGYYEEGQGGMKGTPWEFKERYISNSPFFFLERVKTPLMIQRGANDRISIESGNLFNALRSLGKDVEFLEYEHEDHVVQQPVNLVDFWNRRIEWINRYLTPKDPTNAPKSPQ